MSGGARCRCVEGGRPISERPWYVIVREGNYSAFNGYHFTHSDYSSVRCDACGAHWRTKADYVLRLKDVKV
jgi:hypothetical protein